jgi:metal-sulfur cluster biosynthetic enzyme
VFGRTLPGQVGLGSNRPELFNIDSSSGTTYVLAGNLQRMGVSTVTKEMVMDQLRKCFDPEIPIVSLVDLGLIYDVRIDDKSNVDVDMTLTAQGCPAHQMISQDAEMKIRQLSGVGDVRVHVVWEPAWTPERMSDNARKALGWV